MENIIAYVTGLFNRDSEIGRNAQNVRTIVSEELNAAKIVATSYLVDTISNSVCWNLNIA